MWKLLLIAFLAGVGGVPLENAPSPANWYNLLQTTGLTCRCPSSSTASDQIASPVGANQPVPFGVSNVGNNFYQSFLVNGAVPFGRISDPASSPTPSKAPPREDYTYTPGVGAHKFHRVLSTWNEARKSCNSEGGHLAIINSKAEAQVLVKMMTDSGMVRGAVYDNNVFLGIHDLYKEGEWVTIFGESLGDAGYEQWSVLGGNQPNNHRGSQNCGTLQIDGGLNDVGCTDLQPYFCEQINV